MAICDLLAIFLDRSKQVLDTTYVCNLDFSTNRLLVTTWVRFPILLYFPNGLERKIEFDETWKNVLPEGIKQLRLDQT